MEGYIEAHGAEPPPEPPTDDQLDDMIARSPGLRRAREARMKRH